MSDIKRDVHPAVLLGADLFQCEAAQLSMLKCSLALCAWHENRGDSNVPLELYAEQNMVFNDGSNDFEWQAPTLNEWKSQLEQLELLNNDNAPSALILKNDCLAWHRLFRHEQQLAQLLINKAQQNPTPIHKDQASVLHKLFAYKPGEDIDWQLIAAFHCLSHKFSIITGGPGTGKTSTISKVIALLSHDNPDAHICLAAPTGKAAARMLEAITNSAQSVSQSFEDGIAFPEQAHTLHRLRNALKRGQFERLSCLIIDEVSMADVSTLNSCLQLLPENCQIILLGDPMQLASVESGSVLIDLCKLSPETYSQSFCDSINEHCSYQLESSPVNALAGSRVTLKTNWRFKDAPGITALSNAILAGTENIAAISNDHDDCHFNDITQSSLQDLLNACLPHFSQMRSLASPQDALQHLRKLAILCAWKKGPWSVGQCNSAFDSALREQWQVSNRDDWYHGKPFMILRNNYDLSVYNGDIGVIWNDLAWIDSGDVIQSIPIHDLSDAEPLFASSIHKSQGSQFDAVHVLLPDIHTEHLNRSLYYTGVTRAKQAIHIWSYRESLKSCCEQEIERHTGLGFRLAEITSD